MTRAVVVRHFRQIVVWPLQLMPLRPGQQVQRHWEALEAMKGDNHWREVVDEFSDPADFHERKASLPPARPPQHLRISSATIATTASGAAPASASRATRASS